MRVAIVGGGFSGTMMAVELVRLGRSEIVLIERRMRPAQGMAYSTDEAAHLLNVRADNMSAFADAPDHFARWAVAKGVGRPDGFVRRRDYRRYLEEQLALAERSGKLQLVRDTAIGLAADVDGIVIALASGGRIGADQAVMAGGNYPGHLPAALGLPEDKLVHDPWSADGVAAVKRLAAETEGDLLLLGTGLTMVDTTLTLADAGFAGRILAVSRRGLVPHAYQEQGSAPLAWQPPARLGELMREIRRRSAEAGWRPVVEGLRPHSIALWRGFTDEEKRRFLRHARPWWDIHRHRIAPEVGARIARLRDEGRLEVVAGRIAAAEDGRVTIARRGGGAIEREVAAAINCTGPAGEIARVEDSLIRQLLASGLARPDALGLGLDVDAASRVAGPAEGLYALGPLTRGAFWEIVAVPDIRRQVRDVARLVSGY
ncbi:MAG: FAD-dependent oxidoreductase [Alphaproteobacteria bacterium]|nr:FAD-dependent oxidoreductase [Alphaproteobacteria bacterium]